MHLTGLDLFFWTGGLMGHAALLAVLFARGLARRFPIFTALVSCSIVRTLGLFAIRTRYGDGEAYFYAYWWLAILDTSLQIGLVYELAANVFRPGGTWAAGTRQSAIALTLLSTGIAGFLTFIATPVAMGFKYSVVLRGTFFASALMSVVFTGLLVSSVRLGVSWKTHTARIAQGFGAYSVMCLLIEGVHAAFGLSKGTPAYLALSRVRIGGYMACLTFWVVALAMRAPEECVMPEQMRVQLAALQSRAAVMAARLRGLRSA